MNNKALLVLLTMAVLSATTARLISIWNGQQPYRDKARLALTVDRCPDSRYWLAEHGRIGGIDNGDYYRLARWTVARENDQASGYLASGRPITCHALKDWHVLL